MGMWLLKSPHTTIVALQSWRMISPMISAIRRALCLRCTASPPSRQQLSRCMSPFVVVSLDHTKYVPSAFTSDVCKFVVVAVQHPPFLLVSDWCDQYPSRQSGYYNLVSLKHTTLALVPVRSESSQLYFSGALSPLTFNDTNTISVGSTVWQSYFLPWPFLRKGPGG